MDPTIDTRFRSAARLFRLLSAVLARVETEECHVVAQRGLEAQLDFVLLRRAVIRVRQAVVAAALEVRHATRRLQETTAAVGDELGVDVAWDEDDEPAHPLHVNRVLDAIICMTLSFGSALRSRLFGARNALVTAQEALELARKEAHEVERQLLDVAAEFQLDAEYAQALLRDYGAWIDRRGGVHRGRRPPRRRELYERAYPLEAA